MGYPIIPDIEYRVQLLFLTVFTVIIYSALFVDSDYLSPLPADPTARDNILVRLF
jgi:hypothetical protein